MPNMLCHLPQRWASSHKPACGHSTKLSTISIRKKNRNRLNPHHSTQQLILLKHHKRWQEKQEQEEKNEKTKRSTFANTGKETNTYTKLFQKHKHKHVLQYQNHSRKSDATEAYTQQIHPEQHHHHHWLDSPWWTLAFLRSFAHSFLSRATFFQFLTSNILTSWSTPSSHRNFGLPTLLTVSGLVFNP